MFGSNFREKKLKKIFNAKYVNARYINANSNNSTLSHSIKIFSHRSNSIESKDILSYSSFHENSSMNPMNDIGFIHLKEIKAKKTMKKKYNIIYNKTNYYKNKHLNTSRIGINEKEKEKTYNSNSNKKNFVNNSINHTITKYIKNLNANISLSFSKINKNNYSNNFWISKKEYNITKIKPNKNKIKTEIENAKIRIKLLNNVLNNTMYKYRHQTIINYKKQNRDKLLYLKRNFLMENTILQNNIFFHKLKLSKMQDNYIKIDKLKDEIEKQELTFKKQKCSLIDRIIDLSIFIDQLSKNNNNILNKSDNSMTFSEINDLSIDEMLSAKNRNVHKITHFCLNTFHK